jgi:ABC-type transporter Mla subunit MlaD
MSEHERRQQVLQAEEAIVQLADQLALARQRGNAADEAAGKLQSALTALERSGVALQETTRAVEENAQRSSAALAEAREHLEEVRRQVSQACDEWQALARQVSELAPTLQRHLETALREVAEAVRVGNQGQELLRKEALLVRRLLWALLGLGALGCGAALALVVRGLRPG